MLETADHARNPGDAPSSTSTTAAALPGARLPAPLTRFVGRAAAIDEVESRLRDSRLLTVTGAGGSGKTRLALEIARRAGKRDAGSVVWVELAPVVGPEMVPQHVAAAFGLREEGGRSAFDSLMAFLHERQLLLVVDNCEHVVDACAAMIGALLEAAPGLRVLATSREPLGVPGERAWLIPALSLPDEFGRDTTASEAVQLFVDRARDVAPDFELDATNTPAVVQICRRLEGLPLAIELAAARVRVLPPEQLAPMLDDAFRALGSRGRGTLPRHRTLRAVMDWSYALLSGEERVLLERLAVFDGGFTLDAVETVCSSDSGDDALDPHTVLDVLAALVDRSLVAMRENDGRARYRLLETVRQYAAEHLRASGIEQELRRRHAAYYMTLVADAEPHLITPARRERVELLRRDVNNLRQVLTWTREHDPERHLELAGRLCWFWFSSRDWLEGRRWLEGALALPVAAAPTRARAAALFGAGMLAALQAEPEFALACLGESAALAAASGDDRLEAYAHNYIGMALIQDGRPEGREPVEKALGWFQANNDLYGLRLSHLLLGTLAVAAGDTDEAYRLTTEAVRIARSFGADRELGVALQMHSMVLFARGELAPAADTAREALAALRADPMYLFVARGLEQLGAICVALNEIEEAVRLHAAAAAIRSSIGARAFGWDRGAVSNALEAGRTVLGRERFEQVWNEGAALDVDGAIAAALLTSRLSHSTAAPAGATPRRRASDRVADPAASALVPAPQLAGSMPETAAPDRAGDARNDEAGIEIRALGKLCITLGGAEPQAVTIPYARPRELLFYLLVHPEGRTRDQVGVVFWPDASAAQVKNSFHVALHHLRRSIGRPDAVVLENDRYRINPELPVWFDAAVFEREMEALLREARRGGATVERLRRALELYRGHFLDGSDAGDWHLEIHDRLLRLCIDGHSALAALLMQDEQWAEAAVVLERLLQFEPLDEEALRKLMHCLATSGDRTRALRQFERFNVALDAELGAQPQAATLRLAERLRQDAASA
jgi:predicted ATPase/DNA-binding SARP family transcriptional activator